MRYELAESILKNSMGHWDTQRMSEETRNIQIISEIKYDDYEQYTHGMRYVESLALWMRQFDTAEDKDCAYDLVKNDLVFISQEEMRQLITYAYPMAMKKYLMNMTKEFCQDHSVTDMSERKKIYRHYMRCSLFLGLSDGAHIDFFRRQNPALSNEQVFVHYDFSKSKAEDMKKELAKDSAVRSLQKQYAELPQDEFVSYFLIDDFTGSGKSYIRKDGRGWHGKLKTFFERLIDMGYDTTKADVHLVLYLSTERSLKYIREKANEFTEENDCRSLTVDALQIVRPIDWGKNETLSSLLQRNFEKYMKLDKKSYVDKHFEVGEGKTPYYGFGDCSLPLILYHNTPNNTLPVLWYSWEDEVNALFLRITRHKEI